MVRADRQGQHRTAFEKNKKRLLMTQNTCGMSPVVDHIVPISKGGHPSSIDNLQLAHWQCNRQKSDKLYASGFKKKPQVIGNRNLPQSLDWSRYRGV